MLEEQIQAYIEGFVKQAMAEGLTEPQAVELMMKIASDDSIEYPEDQLINID
jgi:hypothetical protein